MWGGRQMRNMARKALNVSRPGGLSTSLQALFIDTVSLCLLFSCTHPSSAMATVNFHSCYVDRCEGCLFES